MSAMETKNMSRILSHQTESSLLLDLRLNQLLAASSGTKNQSFWERVCNEIDGELNEVDLILGRLGLPPYNYRKDKVFPTSQASGILKKDNCISRVYLDSAVFPNLLPAIQAMLDYAQSHRPQLLSSQLTFQFNPQFDPLDYITQHLYANNPKYPQRKLGLVPPFQMDQIPWAVTWTNKFPRPIPPKWIWMSEEEAAGIIQNAVRIWLARRKRKELEMKRQLKNKETLQPQTSGGNAGDCGTKEANEDKIPKIHSKHDSE